MYRQPWVRCLSVLFLLSFMSSSANAIILAMVNEVPITDQAVDESVASYLRQIGHRQLSDSRMVVLQKQMLKKRIEEELLYQEGLKKGLHVAEQEIEIGIAQIRNRFPSESAFRTALSKEVLDLGDLRKGVERSILIKKTWEGLLEMPEDDRAQRLQEITENARIQIHSTDSGEDFRHYQ